jgi:cell division protein FtsI/penicillin-binding protein 2
MIFLINLQFFEKDKFEDKERIQGQRRILRPGARGDVLDRNGKILIANKAQFSAVIHLDALKSEIWEKKVSLKKLAFKVRDELAKPNLSFNELLKHCFNEPHIQSRGIMLSGKKINKKQRTKLFLGNHRLTVKENENGTWSSEIVYKEIPDFTFRCENNDGKIRVNVAGLFETNFFLHDNDQFYANNSDSIINNNSESPLFDFFKL